MLSLDKWLGIPLCFILTMIKRLKESIFVPKVPQKVEKVMIIKLAEMGATVVAEPAIKNLTNRIGKENLYFMVFGKYREIITLMDLVPANNIIEISLSNPFSFLFSLVGALRRVRKEGIDCSISFEFFNRIGTILGYISGVKMRVGYETDSKEKPYCGDLFSNKVYYRDGDHISYNYNRLMAACFPEIDESYLPAISKYTPGKQKLKNVRKLIHEKTGAYDPNIIVISANIIDFIPLRRWPEQNFLELANRLAKRYPDFYILFVGLNIEQQLTNQLLAGAESSKIKSIVGETKDLKELITLFSLSDLLITSDSGPAHFACLSDINTLTMFGPETPRLFKPMTENSWAIGEQADCSPCFSVYNGCHSTCKNNICLKNITVDQMEEKASQILDSQVIKKSPGKRSWG